MVDKLENRIGILSYEGDGKGRQKGSGCIFYYKNKWIIATAAHCVYNINDDVFYKDFKFTIPSSKITYTLGDVFLHKYWSELYAPEYDIAFFTIDCDDNCLKFDKSYLTPYFNIPIDESFIIAGFPGKIIFANKLYIKKNNIGIADRLYFSNLIGIKTCKKEGMSGGPLLCQSKNRFNIVGTVSLSFVSEKGVLWCAPWNEDFKLILDYLVKEQEERPSFIETHSWRTYDGG